MWQVAFELGAGMSKTLVHANVQILELSLCEHHPASMPNDPRKAPLSHARSTA